MSNSEFVFGRHSVTSLLQTAPQRVVRLYLQAKRRDLHTLRLIALAQQQGIVPHYLSTRELNQLLPTCAHQGVIAKYRPRLFREANLENLLDAITTPAFLLILDGVQDPHNLGACLRSANAAGVQVVLAPTDRSVGLTSTVRKVACGAAETTPFIQVTNLARTLRQLKERGIWLYGMLAGASQSLYQARLIEPLALIVGAEAQGLRRLTREHCDKLLSLPRLGTIESLNVSVATGIGLFEVVRQRQQAGLCTMLPKKFN